jgi:hypothetical protein
VNWISLSQDRDHWWVFCEHGNEPWVQLKMEMNISIVYLSDY